MIRRTTLLASLAVALALALPLQAQDAELRALAQEYVSLPGMQGVFDAMADPKSAIAQVETVLSPANPLPPEVRDRLITIVSEEIAKTRPALEAAMLEVTVTQYTADELRAMLDFFETPLGLSILNKQGPITTQLNEMVAPLFAVVMLDIQQRLIDEFSQRPQPEL